MGAVALFKVGFTPRQSIRAEDGEHDGQVDEAVEHADEHGEEEHLEEDDEHHRLGEAQEANERELDASQSVRSKTKFGLITMRPRNYTVY